MNIWMLLANPFTHDTRVAREATALAQAGHRVTVLAWDACAVLPPDEQIDGVQVLRLSLPPILRPLSLCSLQALSKGGLRQAQPPEQVHPPGQSHLLPLLGHQAQLRFFWHGAARLLLYSDCQAVHCHDLETLPVGLRVKQRRAVSLIYDAHDIYTYLLRRDLSRLLEGYYRRLERRAAPLVDALIVADPAYQPYFTQAGYPLAQVVMNCGPPPAPPIFCENGGGVRGGPGSTAPFTLCYAGGLHRFRLARQLVEWAADWEGVRLVIAGMGAQAEDVRRICLQHEHLDYRGMLPRQQVIELLQEAHGAVRLLDPQDANNRLATSNLQFMAMSAGRPIITTAGTRSAQLALAEGCGLAVENTPQALRQAVYQLRDDPALARQMGQRALQAAQERYNWQLQSANLLRLYERLAKEKRP